MWLVYLIGVAASNMLLRTPCSAYNAAYYQQRSKLYMPTYYYDGHMVNYNSILLADSHSLNPIDPKL